MDIEGTWQRAARAVYEKHPRARSWAVSPDAKRWLVWLWLACEKLDSDKRVELFNETLEQLADAGVNCLSQKPPNELEVPDWPTDAWNRPLENPWKTNDLRGQSLLAKTNPLLATWMQKFAESPYAASAELADLKSKALAQRTTVYDFDSHRANVFCNGASETEKAAFVRNAPAHVLERAKWEATPMQFPTHKDFNLTPQSRIAKSPRLSALWQTMTERERTWREGARAKARADIEAAQKHLKELETVSK
jgi:hypothetical protein